MLCCDLAKLENITMMLNFLFFIGLLWPNKGHCLCKCFSYPDFIFVIFAIFGAKNEMALFRSVKVLIVLVYTSIFFEQNIFCFNPSIVNEKYENIRCSSCNLMKCTKTTFKVDPLLPVQIP